MKTAHQTVKKSFGKMIARAAWVSAFLFAGVGTGGGKRAAINAAAALHLDLCRRL